MDEVREQLQRAYRYIRHDRTQEAQQILRPLLQADSDNVHAWWLLAHAVTDPEEIRHALTRVLTLDPAYPNADKARQLLDALESRLVTPAGIQETLTLAEDETFAREEEESWAELEGTFALPETKSAAFLDYEAPDRPQSAPEPLETLILDDEETAELARAKSAEEDPFAHLEEDLFSDKFEQEDFDTAELIRAIDADQVDLEALLKLEEQEAQEQVVAPATARRRRPGILFWSLATVIALVGLVVLVFRIMSQEEESSQDPGPLAPLAIEDLTLAGLLKDLNTELGTQGLGQEYRAIVAPSSLGKTIYVEFCLAPQVGLADAVMRGMELAARQATTAAGQVDAVGISVNRCQAEKPDTLYRAQVPLEAVQRYLNGELGSGETGLASFQAYWSTS